MEDLRPALASVAALVEDGFGELEVDEVMGVAEEMPLDATRTFRFVIRLDGSDADLWVSVSLDDVDSPDLRVWAPAGLAARIDAALEALVRSRG